MTILYNRLVLLHQNFINSIYGDRKEKSNTWTVMMDEIVFIRLQEIQLNKQYKINRHMPAYKGSKAKVGGLS